MFLFLLVMLSVATLNVAMPSKSTRFQNKNDLMSMVKLCEIFSRVLILRLTTQLKPEEFPAYSSVLLRQRNYLRTIRVMAAVYRFFCSNTYIS